VVEIYDMKTKRCRLDVEFGHDIIPVVTILKVVLYQSGHFISVTI